MYVKIILGDDLKMFKKKISSLILVFILLLGMMAFPYLPIVLFNIKYDSFGLVAKTVYMTICDIIYMVIIFFLYKEKIIKDFKNYFKNFMSNFEYSFKFYFIGLLGMLASNLVITFLLPDAIAGNEEAVREMINSVPLYMIFSVSIYAPFVEEMIFRHSIKEAVYSFGNSKIIKFIYILISGFLFAGAHIFGQATNVIDYFYIIPYLALSISFASLYSKSDNVFSSISMHCLHNTFTIILYFISGGVL